ncbi:glycosyltransferase [Roseobacter litoralis]|uniref:glycosyltransferase n=1 Tax=Roseobacter litoralis TaxID=42443 RepID=UPI00249534CE|nr:glycosyltransferase [Roseobacter litoralis]
MADIAAVIIGRNEGARLVACLASLGQDFARIIYVDSGSTDGSLKAAQDAGAEVVALDTDRPFTAARARNAGIEALKTGVSPDFVQFIDGDCMLDPGWIATALGFLVGAPEVAVVCGRRRERFPENSIYNRLCDAEWNTPIGEAHACGGDALMRWEALMAVDGYNPDLIAGEEPEMCLRMRRLGWKIWRLDAEMTLHDAAILRFGQFWKRARRGGYAYAQGAAMYGRAPERHGVAGVRRILIWGAVIPVLIVFGLVAIGPLALVLLAVYPLQVARIARRKGGTRGAWEQASLLTVGKFAELQGIGDYLWRRWQARDAELIEYK